MSPFRTFVRDLRYQRGEFWGERLSSNRITLMLGANMGAF
jgi:hypothetical protein